MVMTVSILCGDSRDVLRQMSAESVHCVVTSPPEILAYCAGVIDSDGTIGIKRNSYSMRVIGDCGQATYSERICVKQVEPHAVDLLHSLFGGTRYNARPGVKHGKPLHVWQVTDRKAVACLRALVPFLRIKLVQAENCLRLREIKEKSKSARVARGRGHIGSAARPAHFTEAMQQAYLRAKELNAVGAGERRLPCP
jgi:hypothetical protein